MYAAQAEEEGKAALELAQRLEKKLARKQDMSKKHQELDEGLQRMRARIKHQETLLQVHQQLCTFMRSSLDAP